MLRAGALKPTGIYEELSRSKAEELTELRLGEYTPSDSWDESSHRDEDLPTLLVWLSGLSVEGPGSSSPGGSLRSCPLDL